MAEEEEVMMEVEAVEAVYGDDCIVLDRFPPHLHIHIKPRTADVHSRQFVEATIEIRASAQYPSDPPCVDIIDSKGLDDQRLKHLSASLHDMTRELASCLMLVALCEEAVDTLSSMNHPEGDCPLCLYPLVPEKEHRRSLSFMKLMSCFHCFHCECIIRWLKWILETNEGISRSSSIQSNEENQQASDVHEMMGDNTGNCPVCRKVFLAKDIEHVLNLVDSHVIDTDVEEKELSEILLQCELETSRKKKFEAILELQLQRGGLIESPKDNILFSRISIQDLIREAELETKHGDQTAGDDPEQSGSSDQTHETTNQRRSSSRNRSKQPAASGSRARSYVGQGQGQDGSKQPALSGSRVRSYVGQGQGQGQDGSKQPAASGSRARSYVGQGQGWGQGQGQHRHSSMRKHGRGNSKPQAMQWTRKD